MGTNVEPGTLGCDLPRARSNFRMHTSAPADKLCSRLCIAKAHNVRGMTSSEIAASLPQTAVTSIDNLPFSRVASGKVREIFDLGDALLLAATDRLSAFDVVLPDGIPGKGAILTQISNWWFAQTTGIIQNHLLPDQPGEFSRRGIADRDLQLRSMVVRKLKTVPIECVVRGYLVGSGWSSYQKTGEVCGIKLPPGLRQADRSCDHQFIDRTHESHID